MEIFLNRLGTGLKSTDISTIGKLMINNLHCLILEDDYDKQKEYGHTRIPKGRYELKLRKAGRIHEKYSKLYPEMHKGMIHLQDIPNYTYIYIHRGNSPEDTLGCLLTGTKKGSKSSVVDSAKAYELVYPIIAAAIEKEDTFINITD